MTKIKRNDPCPCGSGKKYKRCCALNDPAVSETQLVNQELDRVHGEFISSITSDYVEAFETEADNYQLTKVDEETTNIYQTGLALWIPFHVPSLEEDNRTIHADFLWANSHRMSTPGQELFKAWGDCLPSAYKVLGIDDKHHFLYLEACRSQKRYQVPYNPSEDFSEARLLIGTLVPYADQHSFFFTIIKLYEREPEDMTSLLESYSRKRGGLQMNFPDFLADALLLGQDTHDWNRPIHKEVARLFADYMVETNQSDAMVFQGISLWQRFADNVDPAPRTPNAFAAALSYLVLKDLIQDTSVIQSELANYYNCTTGTISLNYRKLSEELDIHTS